MEQGYISLIFICLVQRRTNPTSRDPTIRRLIGYWNRTLVSTVPVDAQAPSGARLSTGTNVGCWVSHVSLKYSVAINGFEFVFANRTTFWKWSHYCDVIMGAIASQITSLTIVYSSVYSSADQRKHQSSTSMAFVRGIHRWPVNSPHKWLVTRKMFPFDDVIIHFDSWPFWCWGRNITEELSQYHGNCCSGSLCGPLISGRGFDCERQAGHCLIQETISITSDILVCNNYINCK